MAYLNKLPKRFNLDLNTVIDGVNGYIESESGSIGGVSYTCDNGDHGYVIFDWIKNDTASFQQRYVSFEFKQFHYIDAIGEWAIKKPNLYANGNISKVDDSGFIEIATGSVVDYATAHEDDLTKPIPDTDPQEYEQKLKAGYTTEYQYWFDTIGLSIIQAAQNSIINRLV